MKIDIQTNILRDEIYRAVYLGYERDYTTSEIVELIIEVIENIAPISNSANGSSMQAVQASAEHVNAVDATRAPMYCDNYDRIKCSADHNCIRCVSFARKVSMQSLEA